MKLTLYHGTATSRLEAIRRDGLRPRGETGLLPSHTGLPSKPEYVYLTNAYALKYAIDACESEDDWPVILRVSIDLDLIRLYPDEDFVGMVMAKKLVGKVSPQRLIEETDVSQYDVQTALNSLHYFGTCCVKRTIEPKQIRGWVVVKNKYLLIEGVNTGVGLTSYQLLGKRNRALMNYLFRKDDYPVDEATKVLMNSALTTKTAREDWKRVIAELQTRKDVLLFDAKGRLRRCN